MPSKQSRIVAEWTWAKHFADEVVRLAERCDIPMVDLANACMLTGERRREKLRSLGDAVRQRHEAFIKEPGDGRAETVPLRYAGLVQNSVACLRRLASAGDRRAREVLTYVILLHPEHVREDDRLDIATFGASAWAGAGVGNARSLCFKELEHKLGFGREVGRSLYMESDNPTLSNAKPSVGDIALVLLCEHSSAIFALDYRSSAHWHVVRVEEVRRTRFTATLLARPDRPDGARKLSVGQKLDYPIAAVVTHRDPASRSVQRAFTFRIPPAWHDDIANSGILPVLCVQPWPSRIAGWDACFTADDRHLNLYLVDLTLAEGRGGWDDDDFLMSFTLSEIDHGKGHVARIGNDRILVRSVWDSEAGDC